jgi:hypothetical protein
LLTLLLSVVNVGNFYKTQEAEIGLGKSNRCEDKAHVLQAIVEGWEDEFQWPDMEKRQEVGAVFSRMFKSCL